MCNKYCCHLFLLLLLLLLQLLLPQSDWMHCKLINPNPANNRPAFASKVLQAILNRLWAIPCSKGSGYHYSGLLILNYPPMISHMYLMICGGTICLEPVCVFFSTWICRGCQKRSYSIKLEIQKSKTLIAVNCTAVPPMAQENQQPMTLCHNVAQPWEHNPHQTHHCFFHGNCLKFAM